MTVLPRITVVTPSFNQAPFLEQTILSVLGQCYPNLEYIVMDGGSTDGSREIIERYAPQLAYWQSQPDGGQAAAINAGFARATGEILCWLNSDDYFLPGALHRIARHVRCANRRARADLRQLPVLPRRRCAGREGADRKTVRRRPPAHDGLHHPAQRVLDARSVGEDRAAR